MAAHRQALLLAAVVVAAACLASMASATEWMVGDKDGWRAKFNTTGWANDKTFRVGDTLSKRALPCARAALSAALVFSQKSLRIYNYIYIYMHIYIHI
jgi:hypothetical protein